MFLTPLTTMRVRCLETFLAPMLFSLDLVLCFLEIFRNFLEISTPKKNNINAIETNAQGDNRTFPTHTTWNSPYTVTSNEGKRALTAETSSFIIPKSTDKSSQADCSELTFFHPQNNKIMYRSNRDN